MITKAEVVEKILGDPYHYKVRIPLFDRINDSPIHTDLSDYCNAKLASPKGINDSIQVGDIVFVGFEDNDPGNAIILGHLYREDLTKDFQASLNLNNLTVKGSATLPIGTQIGDIPYDSLYQKILNSTNALNTDTNEFTSPKISSLETDLKSLENNLNSLSTRVGTTTTLGGIKAGNGLNISSTGVPSFGPVQTSGTVSYLDRDTINYCRGNRFECLPYSCISSKLQYWGMLEGDTEAHWIDKVDANYLATNNLFNTSNTLGVDVGDDSDTINSTYQVIIDLDLTKLPSNIAIYSAINKLYLWVSTNGGKLSCQVLGSRPTNSDFHQLCAETSLTGWSGSNIIPLSLTINKNADVSNHTKDQYNKLRFIFKGVKSTSNRFPKIFKLAAYGSDGWSFQNNMANFDHMYSWDNECNVTFPNKLNAKSPLEGITLSEDFVDDTTVVTIGYLKAKGLLK